MIELWFRRYSVFILIRWSTECLFRLAAVAEAAESIDNPMHEAAKRGVTSCVSRALHPTIYQRRVLFFFFFLPPWWTGNLSWLRECIENKVGVNGLDKAGNTALYWACHGGHKGSDCCVWKVQTYSFTSACGSEPVSVLCQTWWSCCSVSPTWSSTSR